MTALRRAAPVLALLALPLLAACAQKTGREACATANSEVNLGNLLGASLSGSYDGCVEQMRADLAAARMRARALEAQADRLERERARLSQQEAEAARRLAGASRRQSTLVTRLERAESDRDVDQAELQRLLDEEARLGRRLEDLGQEGGVSSAEAAEIRREQDEILARMESLMGM